MRRAHFTAILFMLLYATVLHGQEAPSKSEKYFAKIKIKEGTRDVKLINNYDKRWKMRVNFPETSKEKNSLIIALHWAGGGDTYKEFNDCLALPALKALNAIIVAPDGENQLWTTQNNIEKVVSISKNAQKYWNVDPKKIAIMGYSNGGNGSWYFAEKHPKLFSAAIPMASAYAIDKQIDVPIYVIHGAKDELFELAKSKRWIDKTKKAGTELILAVNDELSHYQGCSYIAELKKAGEWLKALWKEK